MDKINNINSVVAALRKQISKRSAADIKKNSSTKTTTQIKGRKNEPISEDSILNAIQSRISKIQLDTENQREELMVIIAETIVTSEFGSGIINDPNYDTLISEIVNGYKSEPLISNKLDQIINHDLKQKL